jgi:nucleoside-diphosphate-sugar epimerase
MKCLITGASGFLGKRLLQLLVEDSRVETLHIISRTKKTHPARQVKIHYADLTTPWSDDSFFEEIDTIVHLAGLYQFGMSFAANYENNVLPTLNLIDTIQRKIRHKIRFSKKQIQPQIFFASTYAVGLGSQSAIEEAPLSHLPQIDEPYAYTKALAERALSDSGLSARIFRFGVLVGDTVRGEVEKVDGPYYFLRLFSQLRQSGVPLPFEYLPMPLDPQGVLPLVPVDCAAHLLHTALFMPPLEFGQQEYFGAFHPESIKMNALCQDAYQIYLNRNPPKMYSSIPAWLMRLQARITGIPSDLFHYTLNPVQLKNPRF